MISKKNLLFYILYSTFIIIVAGSILVLCNNDMNELLQAFFPAPNALAMDYIVKILFLLVFSIVLIIGVIAILGIKPETSEHKKTGFLVAGIVFYFIAFLLLMVTLWSLTRFPMDQPEIVFFGLININGPVEEDVYPEVIRVSIFCTVLALVLLASVIVYQKKTKNTHFSIAKFKDKHISINVVFFGFSLLLFVFALFDMWKTLDVSEYVKVISRFMSPAVDSEFYKEEYVVPDYNKIVFPEKKKNVIICLLESMESSFADEASGGFMRTNLIPNITKIANDHINFSDSDGLGGGVDVAGTSWTAAALCSKFAGLPFNIKKHKIGDKRIFLPGAITLTDILARNGYTQRFLIGSDKHFGSRDVFLETHGNVAVHDLNYFWDTGKLPSSYHVFWGFEDQKLYGFAKEELQELGKGSEPFMFGFLTVDTHTPNGWQCEDCSDEETKPLRNSIKCADRQLADFLAWCKEQDWYDDTVIVIMGDHLFMSSRQNNPFDDDYFVITKGNKNPRRWIDIFINASINQTNSVMPVPQKNRVFSSLDMFPTILASMGCTIEGNRLGFGVNLFSGEKTLCERFPENYLNDQLMTRSSQYEKFETVEHQ